MKKIMLIAIIIAGLFSCIDPMEEASPLYENAYLLEDSLANTANKNKLTVSNDGLTYTKQEIKIWKERSKSAQYSDSWSRILRNSDEFILNPNGEIWSHQLRPVTKQPGGYKAKAVKPVHQGNKLRDAAFRYLVTGEKRFGQQVKEIILKQVKEPSTNFADKSIWIPNIGSQPPSFHIAEWALTLLFAYDYTQDLYSESEKIQVKRWFHNAGKFFKENVDFELDRLFVNRWANDYTPSNYTKIVNRKNPPKYTHVGGHKVPVIAAWNFHNRQASQIRLAAFVGFLVNDSELIQASKKFVHECVKFWAFPDGLTTEFERGYEIGRPEAGFYYSFITLEQLLSISDLFARNGDFSLFNYKTSTGRYGTEGGEKSLWKVALTLCQLKNGEFYDELTKSYSIYSIAKDKKYKIDGFEENNLYSGKPTVYAKEIYLAQYNIYYNDPYIKEKYSKCLDNTNGKQIAGSGPHHNDQGAWGVHPSKFFMYSDLEGVIWPYNQESQVNK